MNNPARAVATRFSALDRWSVASLHRADWGHMAEHLRPLSLALQRVESIVTDDALDSHQLATLRFDGSLDARDALPRSIKGRLFSADAGDVVYSKIDLRNGAIGVVPQEIAPVAFTSEFPIYRVDERSTIAEYIALVFRSSPFRRLVAGLVSGASGRKRVMPSDLLSVEAPLPKLEVQQAIVQQWREALEAAAKCDAKASAVEVEALAEFQEALGFEKAGSPITRRALSVFWRDISRWGVEANQPRDVEGELRYPIVELRAVIRDLENGWSPKCLPRPATATEWGVLKVGAVSFGVFDESQNKALPAMLAPIPALEVRDGDLLISRANVSRLVGACALVENPRPKLMLCDKIFRAVWRPQSSVVPEYLAEVLKTPFVRGQIERSLTGTSPTMKNISKPSLLSLRFPLPPVEVQRRLAVRVLDGKRSATQLRSKASELRTSASSHFDSLVSGTCSF